MESIPQNELAVNGYRRKPYPAARFMADGRVSVRIAMGCWTKPVRFLPISVFQTLPVWCQEEIASRTAKVRAGYLFLKS